MLKLMNLDVNLGQIKVALIYGSFLILIHVIHQPLDVFLDGDFLEPAHHMRPPPLIVKVRNGYLGGLFLDT